MELKQGATGSRHHDTQPSNRTLWNWNLYIWLALLESAELLIVPYGIETSNLESQRTYLTLLIVPYGIETLFDTLLACAAHLLIVPYGIETKEYYTAIRALQGLLIVPYGIETHFREMYSITIVASNRTLWNWNSSVSSGIWFRTASNRTLWNWNALYSQGNTTWIESSNRTLWNWNTARAI